MLHKRQNWFSRTCLAEATVSYSTDDSPCSAALAAAASVLLTPFAADQSMSTCTVHGVYMRKRCDVQDAARRKEYNLEHRDTRQRGRYKFHSPPLLHSSASLASLALSAAWFFFSCLQMSALMLKQIRETESRVVRLMAGIYLVFFYLYLDSQKYSSSRKVIGGIRNVKRFNDSPRSQPSLPFHLPSSCCSYLAAWRQESAA